LEKDKIEIWNPGSPGMEEHQVGGLGRIIETESPKVFFNLRGRELSCSRPVVPIGINVSGISSVRMDMDKNNAVGGRDLLYQDTEDETLLLSKKRYYVFRNYRQI
jgi:hypothetical protein